MALHFEGDGVPLLELALELPDAEPELLDLGREPGSGEPPGSVRNAGRSAFATSGGKRRSGIVRLGLLPVRGRRGLDRLERLEIQLRHRPSASAGGAGGAKPRAQMPECGS